MKIWIPRVIGAAALAAAGFGLTCASAGGPAGAGAGPGSNERTRVERDREAARAYRSAQAEFEAENYAVAESLATELVNGYPDSNWLGPALLLSARSSFERNLPGEARSKAARYLTLYRASDPRRTPGLILVARVLHLAGHSFEAADSLLATPVELGGERRAALQLARQVVSELGLQEIETVTARWPADHPLRPVFEVERASLLLASGQSERGRAVASAALQLELPDPERNRAQNIASGKAETAQWRPIIGAILPLSGPLSSYGRLAEEGIRLAVEEYNRRHVDSVTLVLRDDGDDYERDGDVARELERAGAVAIVGPLRAEGLEQTARRRGDRNLLVVSPTADENLSFRRNTYSLWSTTERLTRGSRALAAFAIRDLQLYRFGVMYPNTVEGRTQLAAFADAVRARGGEIAAVIGYDENATTFEGPLAFLGAAHPQAIYAPASAPRSVIQLAPQFSFYGLRGVQVLGDAEWAEPEVLRQVEPRFINGTVVSTFLYRSSPSVRWTEFVEMYERTYRKGLRGSLVPALAYDATRLVLAALPWGFPRRSAIARSFRATRSFPGATGIFSVEDGALTRRPFVLHIRDRRLIPAFEELQKERVSSDGGPRR